MFDITQFTPSETSFLHLKSPVTEEPLFSGAGDKKQAVGITFHSPGSDAYEAASKRRTNRALVRNKKKVEVSADQLVEDTVEWLADITVSFDNLSYPPAGGATGADLFKAVYSDRKFAWVNEQASAHMGDWAHFLKK